MKRGDHRCYVAVCTATGIHELALTLAKGARTRQLEDAVVGRIALLAIAHASGISVPGGVHSAGSFWRLNADDTGDAEAISAERLEHRYIEHVEELSQKGSEPDSVA